MIEQGPNVRVGLPKGRMQAGILSLMKDAGVDVRVGDRGYRPVLSLEGFEAKLLKPQNVVEMLHAGSRDLGFAGADWVAELDADLVELLDTGLDPVRVVAAAPDNLLDAQGNLPTDQRLVIASEYVGLTRKWIDDQGLNATLVRSYGATEVFPPEDADLIVDNTATGATLVSNGLAIVDLLMRSSTRLFANPRVLDDPVRRGRIEDFVLLLKSVLNARRRIILELNVSDDALDAVIEVLPCMRQPTVAQLHGPGGGYAVRAAVPKEGLPELLLRVKAQGGTDLIVSQPGQIVP